MNSLARTIALVVAAASMSLPAIAAPGLLSKFVTSPTIVKSASSTASTGVDLQKADYSDGWWVPSESGWGVNILQQGEWMALMFYVFNEQGQPVWYRGVAKYMLDGTGYRGEVYQDNGTSFREVNFGPIPLPVLTVGIVNFRPTSLYDGILTFNVGNTYITKSLTRIAFARQNFSGNHSTVVAARINGCGEKSGELSGSMWTEAKVENGSVNLVLEGQGTTCAISGPFQQRGRLGQVVNGSYACSDGSRGQANIDGWQANEGAFSAIITTSSGTCTESGRIAGAKLN